MGPPPISYGFIALSRGRISLVPAFALSRKKVSPLSASLPHSCEMAVLGKVT